MTDRRGPRRTQALVRGGNYKFSFAIEKLSGLWQVGRSDVGIQQRGSGHASYARAQSCRNSLSPEPALTARILPPRPSWETVPCEN
jgi:hypothetical protein